MADNREELSPGSPSKRPRLDLDQSEPQISGSNKRSSQQVSSGSNSGGLEDLKDGILEDNSAPNSDRERSELSSSSGRGAVFEMQGAVSSDQRVVSETSGIDHNVTDSSFMELNETLADISAIPSCSQTLSSSQMTSTSMSESHETSMTTGENEPSSSHDVEDSSAEEGLVLGPKPSGSGRSSPKDGSDDTSDDSDLDLELGNWQPDLPSGPIGWLQRQMISGRNPRFILNQMLPSAGANLPDDMDEFEMWSLILDYLRMLQEPPPRKKLEDVNTFDDALRLLQSSNKILVLTGAGVSVSCGIPDFRSRDGIYARLAVDFPDLPDPQAMFDINYFRRDPRPFFKFAKEIYPGQFRPSTSHKFINLLEHHGKLLCNYTQNIDTLEQVAGITKVVQCHGSFATAKCTNCSYKVDADGIREDIFNQVVPPCPRCPQDTDVQCVMKPEIVFFGEGLPNEFYNSLEDDKDNADLLIVIGSSLKVRPVATIPNMVPSNIPQILINREPLRHMTFDIELLGDGDVIINELCRRLGDGWSHICHSKDKLTETTEMPESPGVAVMEHEAQAKEEFENMPTPPLCDLETKSGEIETPCNQAGTSDDVSSSSDAASSRQHQGPDTNEAEAVESNEANASKAFTEKIDNKPSGSTADQATTDKPSKDFAEASDSVGSSTECVKGQSKTMSNDELDSATLSTIKRSEVKSVNSVTMDDEEKTGLVRAGSDDKTSTTTLTITEPLHNSNDSQGMSASHDPSDSAPTTSDAAKTNKTTTASSDDKAAANPSETSGEVPDQASESGPVVKKKRRRSSIGTYLNPSTYVFVPPNRYIFHGAEVYPSSSPECSDDEDAEARRDSSSDPLGLDLVHHSNLDPEEAELTDPFDPEHKVIIRHLDGNHPNEDGVGAGDLHSSALHSFALHSFVDRLHSRVGDPMLSATSASNDSGIATGPFLSPVRKNAHSEVSAISDSLTCSSSAKPNSHIGRTNDLVTPEQAYSDRVHTSLIEKGHSCESSSDKTVKVNGPDGSHDKSSDMSHDGKHHHKQCSSSSSNTFTMHNGETPTIPQDNNTSHNVQQILDDNSKS